jgi:hypothetical protein
MSFFLRHAQSVLKKRKRSSALAMEPKFSSALAAGRPFLPALPSAVISTVYHPFIRVSFSMLVKSNSFTYLRVLSGTRCPRHSGPS